MTTDTTHITKEGLLQAIEEIRRSEDSETVKAGLVDMESWIDCVDWILARAAELSAQESKPVAWQKVRTEVITQCAAIARLALPDAAVVKHYDGDVIPRDAAIQAMLRIKEAVCGYKPIAPSVSAQDASPKDGWKLVPVDCTVQMMKAFWSAGPFPEKGFMAGWHAAIAAAPEPPK